MLSMNAKQIRQLKALPQRGAEVWQGGLVQMPAWIAEQGSEPIRPYMPIWVAVHADLVHAGELMKPDQRDPAAAVSTLIGFALDSDLGGYRPGRVEVTDAEVAEQLAFLAEVGVEVGVVERLEAVERVLDAFREHHAENEPDIPGPLDGRGVTVERMRCFAEAAAAFFQAAPWQFLTDSDLVLFENPKPPRGMKYATVLGAGRSVFGLGFYGSIKDYAAFRRGSEEASSLPGVWQVSFNPIHEIPPPDAALWQEHNLPAASNLAYPLAIWIGHQREMKRPTAKGLSFLEGLLWALAETSEAEIDSGRWQKEVRTHDGLVEFTLALPDLLKPPSYQEWMKRGFEPDRRAHERMFADMGRYFAEHPPASVEEMNDVTNRLFSGKRFDESITQPDTPQERAQELCYQAFEVHGRRRVQLARQALDVCPDCADAYVILAEQAGTLDAELENYTKAMAAAERTLGPEAFKEHAGHFWGVSETRPYMRARTGVAQCLEQLGRVEEAVDHYQALLELNPDDNQGIRYLLMPKLLKLGRDVEAARLLKKYDEQSANWAYARALLAFRLSGKSAAARRELRGAFRVNTHVPEFMMGEEALPTPPHYSLGSPEEAIICVEELQGAFAATEGALDWLAAEHRHRQREQKTRQREQRRRQRKSGKRKKR